MSLSDRNLKTKNRRMLPAKIYKFQRGCRTSLAVINATMVNMIGIKKIRAFIPSRASGTSMMTSSSSFACTSFLQSNFLSRTPPVLPPPQQMPVGFSTMQLTIALSFFSFITVPLYCIVFSLPVDSFLLVLSNFLPYTQFFFCEAAWILHSEKENRKGCYGFLCCRFSRSNGPGF